MEAEPAGELTSHGKNGVAAHFQAIFGRLTAALNIALKSYMHRVHGPP